MNKLNSLSKLHKAVWKDDLRKVKLAIANLKKAINVDYYGKDRR